MLTLKKVNAAIQAKYPDYQLVKGVYYFYFIGGNSARWAESSVMVNRLNSLTLEGWLLAFEYLKDNYDRS